MQVLSNSSISLSHTEISTHHEREMGTVPARSEVKQETMGRLNGRERARIYPILVARDGAVCRWCGVSATVKPLVVDCIDNSGDHSSLHNLQFLCRSCNTMKNPRSLGRFNPRRVRAVDDFLVRRPMSKEMEINLRAEPMFIKWLLSKLKRIPRLQLVKVINSGAQRAGCGQQAVTRYLDKLASDEGPLRIVEDRAKIAWVKPRSTKNRNAVKGKTSENKGKKEKLKKPHAKPPSDLNGSQVAEILLRGGTIKATEPKPQSVFSNDDIHRDGSSESEHKDINIEPTTKCDSLKLLKAGNGEDLSQ